VLLSAYFDVLPPFACQQVKPLSARSVFMLTDKGTMYHEVGRSTVLRHVPQPHRYFRYTYGYSISGWWDIKSGMDGLDSGANACSVSVGEHGCALTCLLS
jgi:hypothetical protein